MKAGHLYEPEIWLVFFHRRSSWWVERICPGRFKHVSAAGFTPESDCWTFVSVEPSRVRVESIPAGPAFDEWLEVMLADTAVLRVRPDRTKGWKPKPGLWCVTAVAHLLGLRSGALWPDQLWRKLLANGAEIVREDSHGQPDPSESSGHQPDRCANA